MIPIRCCRRSSVLEAIPQAPRNREGNPEDNLLKATFLKE
jgi:hypothetical protein